MCMSMTRSRRPRIHAFPFAFPFQGHDPLLLACACTPHARSVRCAGSVSLRPSHIHGNSSREGRRCTHRREPTNHDRVPIVWLRHKRAKLQGWFSLGSGRLQLRRLPLPHQERPQGLECSPACHHFPSALDADESNASAVPAEPLEAPNGGASFVGAIDPFPLPSYASSTPGKRPAVSSSSSSSASGGSSLSALAATDPFPSVSSSTHHDVPWTEESDEPVNATKPEKKDELVFV